METNDSKLLSLPPEIRNIIYRYALVEGLIRVIQDPPPQPALLQLNRQVRDEAIQIYYQENCFRWIIASYDAGKLIAWCASSKHRSTAKMLLCNSGTCSWANLLVWLKAFLDQKAPGLGSSDSGKTTGMNTAAAKLFVLAKNLRRQALPWHRVKAQLEVVREALAAVSEEWR